MAVPTHLPAAVSPVSQEKTLDLEKVAQGPLTWNFSSPPEPLRYLAATEMVLMHKKC